MDSQRCELTARKWAVLEALTLRAGRPMVEPYLAAPAPALAAVAAPHAAPLGANGGPRFVWQLVSLAPGSPLLASARGAPAQALRATPSAGFADVPGWRVYGKALGHDGHMLYVAQSRSERHEVELEVVFTILIAGLPMALLGLQ